MTNFERLKALLPDEFWQKVNALVKHGLAEHIDYIAWLNSEDEELEHFIRSNEVVEVYPSEAELISLQNEHNIKYNTREKLSDTEIEAYKQQNKKEYIFLGKTQMFGNPYVTIVRNGQVWNVPENITGNIKKIDGFVTDYQLHNSVNQQFDKEISEYEN